MVYYLSRWRCQLSRCHLNKWIKRNVQAGVFFFKKAECSQGVIHTGDGNKHPKITKPYFCLIQATFSVSSWSHSYPFLLSRMHFLFIFLSLKRCRRSSGIRNVPDCCREVSVPVLIHTRNTEWKQKQEQTMCFVLCQVLTLTLWRTGNNRSPLINLLTSYLCCELMFVSIQDATVQKKTSSY